MLPTKGYFQDIECPYYDSSCGRPYCHFRHRKKATENSEEVVNESEKAVISVIPTYKPTPKSELANIHNNKSHIPISYVPDLAFRPDRKSRPLPKFDKPTYKPTPLSILSSANKKGNYISEDNEEHTEAIKEIKQNIANVEYNPAVSLQSTADIDFEDLSTEFDLIDEIINGNETVQRNSVKLSNEVLNTNSKDVNKIKIENEHNVEEIKSTRKHDEKPKQIESSRKHNEKPKQTENSSKSEKHSDKEKQGDKYLVTIIEKSDKNNEKKEKHDEKYIKTEKSRRSKHERSSDKSDKNEKSRSCKDKIKPDKHKISKKEDVKEKSSSKEKNDKEKDKKSGNGTSNKSSSRDKHRKEEKKDRQEKHSSHKNKLKSSDRSKERKKRKDTNEKDKGKTVKQSDMDKHQQSKSKNKDAHKHREASCKKSAKHKKEHDRKKSFDESSNDSNKSIPMLEENIENNFSDLDIDDDETMLECYKIFNEYKPPEKSTVEEESGKRLFKEDSLRNTVDENLDLFSGKKRIAHSNVETTVTYSQLHPPIKPKILNTPGQVLTNRYKIAKINQANKEQEFIIKEMKQPTMSTKRPAPTLLEAAREHKLRKENSQIKSAGNCLVDDIIKGTAKPSISQSKISIKKIAPAQNVVLIEKAKERISKIKQITQVKTIAQTQKSGRVAHVPEVSLSDIPDVLQAEKSKLPVNVRTRFLTMIADECVKLYISKEEAFARALNEEFASYEKCKVLATYRNSTMLAVNRLRKEIQERDKLGLGLIGLGEDVGKDASSQFTGPRFYNNVKKWVLTQEELDIHGYPRESKEHHGRAVIKNQKNSFSQNLDSNQRTCTRCHKMYQVDDDGWPLFEEECLYHPLKKRTIRGEQTYLCCRSNGDTGCATSDTHVSEVTNEGELEGFQTTMEPEYEDDPKSCAVYALDCEMCYTTKGLELTRVTIVDSECKTVYESLVKPLNPIIDYNTRFSGITKEQMDKTSTSILQIQANILHLCNSKTILVGHSLESDMKALKIVHETIIDTSVLFPHKMGLPHKRALKALASEHLRKIIQNDISGHDSAEDAITCMELIQWKLKEELKIRGCK